MQKVFYLIMIQGISHITLVARDIEKTADLFKKLFGAQEVYSSGEATHSLAKEKFLSINGTWIAIMEGDPIKEKTYNHIALKIDDIDLNGYSNLIAELGLETMQDRKRKPGEGTSIYFYDYDNHLFELHTGTLEGRLDYYRRHSHGTFES